MCQSSLRLLLALRDIAGQQRQSMHTVRIGTAQEKDSGLHPLEQWALRGLQSEQAAMLGIKTSKGEKLPVLSTLAPWSLWEESFQTRLAAPPPTSM